MLYTIFFYMSEGLLSSWKFKCKKYFDENIIPYICTSQDLIAEVQSGWSVDELENSFRVDQIGQL